LKDEKEHRALSASGSEGGSLSSELKQELDVTFDPNNETDAEYVPIGDVPDRYDDIGARDREEDEADPDSYALPNDAPWTFATRGR
jgi:hypothetical protein